MVSLQSFCSPLTTAQYRLASPGLEKVSESALWVDKPAFPQPSNSYQGKFSLKKKKTALSLLIFMVSCEAELSEVSSSTAVSPYKPETMHTGEPVHYIGSRRTRGSQQAGEE